MKARPVVYDAENYTYKDSPIDQATHVEILTHGHFTTRVIPFGGPGSPMWEWNKDVDKPTLKPSIRTTCDMPSGVQMCHIFVTDGMVQYLGDSTHEFAGKTLPLMDHPESVDQFHGRMKALDELAADAQELGLGY